MQILRTAGADLDADGSAVATGLQLTFKCADEIIDLFVVDIQIAVSSNAKLVAAIYLQPGKESIDMHANDRRQKYISCARRV